MNYTGGVNVVKTHLCLLYLITNMHVSLQSVSWWYLVLSMRLMMFHEYGRLKQSISKSLF